MTLRRGLIALIAAGAPACALLEPPPTCPSDEGVLAEGPSGALSCGEAEAAVVYVEVLGGRGLAARERGIVLDALRDRFATDADAVRQALAGARAVTDDLAPRRGAAAGEARATRAWEAVQGLGPFGPDFVTVGTELRRVMSIRAQDDEERLVLTEQDIEGWIRLGSLCREVQGAGPLRLSISDRVEVYRMMAAAFERQDRREQIATVTIGGTWWALRDAWKAAEYPHQQAWIRGAPLPPPMTATSLGYMEAVLGAPATAHLAAIEGVFGPLPLARGAGT